VLTLLVSSLATAQATPRVEFRPFGVFAVERFTAVTTFDATLGSSFQPLWGGGVEMTTRRNLFVDIAVTHMASSGERAFVHNGQVFRLGIPLHAALTPIELTAGYRFPLRRRRRHRIIPYVGAGIGWYRYHEASDFDVGSEEVGVTHAGFVAVAGAEFRATRWIGITGDAQYTHVPGIIGGTSATSLSAVAGESDLGGIAARVRVTFGR
jgi:opacity protein-like surface antigen